MQFPKSFTLNKKFLLVPILPILFSVSTYAMEVDYHLFDVEETKKCCWKKNAADDGLAVFDEPNEPKCELLRSLLGRCWKSLNPHHEEDENAPHCLGIKTETWKRLPLMTAEIATKMAIATLMYTRYGQNELTFFAQHHASESLGRLFKFKKWQLPLTLISGVALYWAGIGILDLEEYFGYSSGAAMVGLLLVYQVIKHYFMHINPEEGHRILMQAQHDIKLLQERVKDLEAQKQYDA